MNEFEQYLIDKISEFPDSKIKEAMFYCNEGGKRFRPRIIQSIVKGFGIDEKTAFPAAAAVEFIQNYSLIHDDLPAMDNDDLRRGKATCHKAFGEDIAILTGDAFLTHSFSILSQCDYEPSIKVDLITTLANYAGLYGMVQGQLQDISANHDLSFEDFLSLQDNKTGGLFKYCCLAGMYLGGSNDKDYFTGLGALIGVIFQNQDDLFDLIKDEQSTGKTISDIRNDKITALSYYNKEELEKTIDSQFHMLDNYLKQAPFDPSQLKELIYELQRR